MSIWRLILALSPLFLWLASLGAAWGQVNISEKFNAPTAAASRFTVNGGVSYTGGAITLQPQSSALLTPGLLDDSGLFPVSYRVTQSFAAGSLVFPQYASAQVRVRASTS